jgi:hypothetical protein
MLIPLLVQTDFGVCMDGRGCTRGGADSPISDHEALVVREGLFEDGVQLKRCSVDWRSTWIAAER